MACTLAVFEILRDILCISIYVHTIPTYTVYSTICFPHLFAHTEHKFKDCTDLTCMWFQFKLPIFAL